MIKSIVIILFEYVLFIILCGQLDLLIGLMAFREQFIVRNRIFIILAMMLIGITMLLLT